MKILRGSHSVDCAGPFACQEERLGAGLHCQRRHMGHMPKKKTLQPIRPEAAGPLSEGLDMPETVIGMIWAQATNGVIGRDGTMPWHLPEDFTHFRHTTAGHPVIMGRRSWESLPPKFRPLPGRTNIVITSNPGWSAPGAITAGSLPAALDAARGKSGSNQAWIIGGGTVYREALSMSSPSGCC